MLYLYFQSLSSYVTKNKDCFFVCVLDNVVIFATSEVFVSVSSTSVYRPLSVSSYDRREILVQHDKIRRVAVLVF